MRYLLLSHFITSTWSLPKGEAAYLVSSYPGQGMNKYTGDGTQQLSIQGKPFQVGDVLSWADMSSLNAPNWYSNGHTAIVTNVSVNSSGNGSFTVLQQNSGNYPTETFSITNWLLQDSIWNGGDQRIVGWLDPNSGGSSGGGTSNSINQHDVFAVGANGHLFDSHWKYGGAWSTTDLGTPSGVTLTGSTTSNTFTKNNNLYQHVEVVGNNGHFYEFWQPIGGSWGINDLNAIAAPEGKE